MKLVEKLGLGSGVYTVGGKLASADGSKLTSNYSLRFTKWSTSNFGITELVCLIASTAI